MPLLSQSRPRAAVSIRVDDRYVNSQGSTSSPRARRASTSAGSCPKPRERKRFEETVELCVVVGSIKTEDVRQVSAHAFLPHALEVPLLYEFARGRGFGVIATLHL